MTKPSGTLTNIEVLVQLMRGAMLAMLLMISPLAMAIPTVDDTQTLPLDPFIGKETVLQLENGVWNQELWDELKQERYVPLRLISPQAILVWQTQESVDFPGVSEIGNLPAVWLGPEIVKQEQDLTIKILLEPRLTLEITQAVTDSINNLGIEILSYKFNYDIPVSSQLTAQIFDHQIINSLLKLDGVLWIEPLLATEARNTLSSNLMGSGNLYDTPHWEFGLNGEGIILGVADSGIDYDHSCFRNATHVGSVGSTDSGQNLTGDIGENHRKLIIINQTIDSGDTPGHTDYRHGTHVAGTLSCHDVNAFRNETTPNNGSTMSYAAKLVFQDIVSSDGWNPPENVTELFYENAIHGGVIHSNSWGDATTAYTARSGDFDIWAYEVPWSLSFVAPGNTGGQLLEPANARNVVAVGATTKLSQPTIWQSSSTGPTDSGTRGIFVVAPGVSIQSANADGLFDSYNNDLRASSGTSMSTPMAASFAGILQQLVEDGWIAGSNEATSPTNLSDIKPQWSTLPSTNLLLSEGFTPSGALLKSLMVLSTSAIVNENEYFLPNENAGWGILDLSQLIDLSELKGNLGQQAIAPASDIWVHDSFRIEQNFSEIVHNRIGENGVNSLLQNPWNGDEAIGPFLQSGDVWKKRLVPLEGKDLRAVMSFNANPEPHLVHDMMMVIKTSNGDILTGENYDIDGYSTFLPASTDIYSIAKSNETTTSIHIPSEEIDDIEWVDIEVHARYIAPGNIPSSVGIDGNKVGFSLAVKGVDRDSTSWEDSDGDGLANIVDNCPNENAGQFDSDEDGCKDDFDEDGIDDEYDLCPEQNALGYDTNIDGCIDDSDNDGVLDDIDTCFTQQIDSIYPVDEFGCRPIDDPPEITQVKLYGVENGVWDNVIELVWTVFDNDSDDFITGAKMMINQTNAQASFPINHCDSDKYIRDSNTFTCLWKNPVDLPIFDISNRDIHIQIFVKTGNMSPEAVNYTVYFDDSNYFTSVEALPLDDGVDNETAAAPFARSFFWGVLTIIGIGLIFNKLRKDSIFDDKNGQNPLGFDKIQNPYKETGENE